MDLGLALVGKKWPDKQITPGTEQKACLSFKCNMF